MVEFDPASGMIAAPVWMTATLAALAVVLAVISILRAGAMRTLIAIAAAGVVGCAGWLALTAGERSGGTTAASGADRTEERRLFEARVNEFTSRAMMPGSPLACLDGSAGDQVAAGCEKLIFGSPDTIAASVSYVSTRVALLNEGTELAATSGLNYDKPLSALRRGLEADPYGIVAQVLLQNPECRPERCESLASLRDPNRIRVNLLEKPFDVLVMRYAANWPAGTRGVAGSGGATASAAAAPPPPATSGQGVPVSSKYDFPSAASIPPVSIMNAEPATPAAKADAKPAGEPKPAAAANAPAPKPAPPKRTAAPKPPAPPARREAAAPTQLAPAQAAPPASAPAQDAPQQ